MRKSLLGRITASLAFMFLAVVSGFSQQAPSDAQRPVVFTHVSVIDATGSPAQPDMTVLVSGGRIAAVGKAPQVAIPRNALVTDARGKFLIPGLWEMHTH